ncbi:MAG: hypothetical protein HY548_02960 [Elusimicrobia bacterium]|nr:hypothetical protein [Elusimicrobiota bacterium]
MKASPEIHELPRMESTRNPEVGLFFAKKVVDSRRHGYKGGRKLPSAERFEAWREIEGISLGEMENRMQKKARESTSKRKDGVIVNFPDGFLLRYLQELEYGRFKSPTWFILLLVETFGVNMVWWLFYDGWPDGAGR